MAAIVRNEDHYDYAIVGGKCFGASSALGLIREWPDARIIWFEGTHTYTASQDESKIIRAAYGEIEFMDWVAVEGGLVSID
jgi:glycine/D-amino acid oxidase-like deaminating enzyme